MARGEPPFEDLTARARIRDAALRHFADHGFARTTIREIARSAGVSPGLVRHHFGSKEELRQACDEHALRMLTQMNDQELSGEQVIEGHSDFQARRALDPFQRYMARALLENSPVAASMFDETVKMIDRSLAQADAAREDPPAADRKLRAALLAAQSMGLVAFQDHVSRVTGLDLATPEGDREASLAMLDISSHSLISPEFAAKAREALGGARSAPSPGGSARTPLDEEGQRNE